MSPYFSLIIPVYNRPVEVQELLESLQKQTYSKPYEIVLVEDGSTERCEAVIETYGKGLQVSYYYKANSGPGDSRNYGMARAKGNYFIVLDSDCILPPHYLEAAETALENDFVHCFGGPDAAHESFSDVQKAINYVMTSFLTTGGIRGGKTQLDKFQPRSFNMGISKEAFEATGGFGNIHPGEDPDLSFRIWKKGYDSKLFREVFVYHKRRIDWAKFEVQVKKFGMVRPILNRWHPSTAKITYWFPSVFIIGLFIAIIAAFFGFWFVLAGYTLYFLLLFIDALLKTNSPKIASMALFATWVQFYGYGTGFLKSNFLLTFSKQEPEVLFPKLFFK
ncbi:glycosyltransferase [Sediminicola luteus]|uniref:Glycosyl transferase family 2 n=1 Tax=Sediminicola luteus TaxID=319238 RepID=A0A2A4G6T7_9FLAO|nr:glycosyltransferase [Sediminicola luteus]PCE63674.1 glycosyl transferase family 2 [Sediminicola luteus]